MKKLRHLFLIVTTFIFSLILTSCSKQINSFSFELERAILEIGETTQITNEIFEPADASNKQIIYTIEDTSIATISNKTITAVSFGNTKVIGKTNDGSNLTYTVNLIVNRPKPTDIQLSFEKDEIEIGETTNAIITISPNDAAQNYTLVSTPANCVAINGNKITGLVKGNARITATTPNGKTSSKMLKINNISVKEIQATAPTYSFKVNETITITTKVLPENAYDKTITFSTKSGNNNIISVTNTGVVTAISSGLDSVIIRSVSNPEVYKELPFYVGEADPESVSFESDGKISINQEIQLLANVYPIYAGDKNVTFSLKNNRTKILTVTTNGLLRGISEGKETVVCSLVNFPSIKYEKEFTVSFVEGKSLNLSAKKTTIKIGENVQIQTTINPLNSSQKDLGYELYHVNSNIDRGMRFENGTDFVYDLPRYLNLQETLNIDVKFDEVNNDNKVCFMLGQSWECYSGYYTLKSTGSFEDNYNGVTLTKLSDGYYRASFDLSQITKVNDKPLPHSHIEMIFIRGAWSIGSGYIDVNADFKDSISVSNAGVVTGTNLGEEYVKVYLKDNPSVSSLIKFKVESSIDDPIGDDVF